MGEMTAAPGHFMIPTAPAAGVAVAQSASANTYGTLTQLIASTAAALFITGVYVEVIAAANLPTYVSVELAVVASTIVDIANVPLGPTSGVAATQWAVYKPIFPPVPVAIATKILAATASSVASAISYLVTLECIAQANVVDDTIVESTNVKQWLGVAVLADANNLPKVDVEDWKAGVVPAVSVTGVPKVDVADWLGSAPNALASGRVDASAGAIAASLLPIKKNTALAGVTFLMFDSTDGRTPKTGLTVTAQRFIDGAAVTTCTNAVVEVSNGVYKIDLSAADLNGNSITFRMTATGADPTHFTVFTQG